MNKNRIVLALKCVATVGACGLLLSPVLYMLIMDQTIDLYNKVFYGENAVKVGDSRRSIEMRLPGFDHKTVMEQDIPRGFHDSIVHAPPAYLVEYRRAFVKCVVVYGADDSFIVAYPTWE